MTALPERADIVVIGGGVIGLSVACHLGWRDAGDVVLLEANQLTSGTSWHAAGIIGPLRASMNLTRLSVYAIETFQQLEAETGQSTGYRQTGGLWLAQTPDRLTELKRIADTGLLARLDAMIIDADATKQLLPLLETADLAGALWVGEDGQANPVDVCMAYAKAARSNGVRIIEGAPVETVDTTGGKVRAVEMQDGRRIACRVVVNCAGAWAHELAARSGIAVPLQAVEHMYVVTEPVAGLPQPCPVVRDLDQRIYIKEDAGKLVLGGFEVNAKPLDVYAEGMRVPFLELPEDWEQFEPFLEAGLKRVPILADAGIQHFMNGPESFTPDTKQLLGEAPECRNYFVAAGFNSIGIVSSAGAGRVMADWVLDGQAPMDVVDLDIARFEPDMSSRTFLAARVREAVSSQFELHWPYKRMNSGRDLRRLPAHDVWSSAGAVFGPPAGWERPLWFAAPADADTTGYSYGAQAWWPAAERECLAARDGAVLIDLSPFAKFDVSGPHALSALQQVCSADVDCPPGQTVYTQWLNSRGGIVADGTIVRLAADHWRFIGAAPSRRRDFAWLSHHADAAALRDVTRDLAVFGLMGPKAGEIWRAAGGAAEALDLGFGGSAETTIGDHRVSTLRVSFIGETGFEIYLPWPAAHDLAALLMRAGKSLGLCPMGLHAVDACRMEKGFRHWGHDTGPDVSPLEAGLGFSVAWDKSDGFIGHDALVRQRAGGVTQRIVQFAVAEGHPLIVHDEPILRDGELAGQVTSGARGFRTGLTLCFASITCAPGETVADLTSSRFDVLIAGERLRLNLITTPPYDPQGIRLRGPLSGPST